MTARCTQYMSALRISGSPRLCPLLFSKKLQKSHSSKR